MADTLTAKLGLKMPDVGDFYDVLKFNFNVQKIDDNIGVVICTSSTRPSSPWNGQQIYETDTRFSYVRSAGAWVQFYGYLTLAASAGTRPSTGLYNGYAIWRTDMKWTEVYDGTAWRVQGTVSTSSLANITDPATDQIAFRTVDRSLYRYTGSVWSRLITGTTVIDAVQTTATIGMTTSFADLTGASVSVTTLGTNSVAKITATLDADANGTTDIGVGVCDVGGSLLPGEIHWGPAGRGSYGRTWKTVLATAATYTIKLRGKKTGSTNNFTTYSTHTGLTVTLYDA